MEFVTIPGTTINIYDGSVVVIARFPDTKWIFHNGFYMVDGKQDHGWYFESIPAGTILPATIEDIKTVTVISTPGGKPGRPPKPKPCPPCPPCPPAPKAFKSVEYYISGVNYSKGQIVYLHTGELYQVVTNYRSSYSEPEPALNLEKDVAEGYLVAIPNGDDIERIDSDLATKMNLVDGAAEGNVATFAEGGQIIDSGITISDIQPVWDDGDE